MDKFKNLKDTERTNAWLKSNGIGVSQIYAGTAELFRSSPRFVLAREVEQELLGCNRQFPIHMFEYASLN